MELKTRAEQLREAFAEIDELHADMSAHVTEHTNGTQLACSVQPDCDSLQYIERQLDAAQQRIAELTRAEE